MHNALTGVQELVTRTPEHAHWLVHFVRGLHFVTTEKRIAMEISYSDARSLITFLWGFILWYQGTRFYVWLWYKREITSKHLAIWFILGGYAPSYKSDSLVFRCSFYYITARYSVKPAVWCHKKSSSFINARVILELPSHEKLLICYKNVLFNGQIFISYW
jgi:hypothetical protein